MNKLKSLIKVSLNHDMNIFKINTKKQSKTKQILIPLLLTFYIMFLMGMYSIELTELLMESHLEYITLTLFAASVSLITLIEGVYKSGSLLFNVKDDNLLLSLPIKRSTVLFIRIFKFYVFELLYNSLFIIPSMVIYADYVHPSWTYYLVSIIALLILPIVPVILSCILGFVISYLSSKFKGKNYIQSIISIMFVFLIIYVSFSSNGFMSNIADKASSLNNKVVGIYYPIGAYISLVRDFDIVNLLLYIFINIGLFAIAIFILGKVYFNINSNIKKVTVKHNKNNKYEIKTNSRLKAFIKKEVNRFVSTPVFITNAGFGLILFVIICIAGSIEFETIIESFSDSESPLDINNVINKLPIIMLSILSFTSFMTSITSSMISLEGKTFNLLKSLPIGPTKIVIYKVLASLTILIGDIIVFIRFKFNVISIILLLIASILLPFISELIGIMMNLKYPKMDATNDTEVVKQSMSSFVSTFIGFGLALSSIIILVVLYSMKLSNNLIILLYIIFYGIICLLLYLRLHKTCEDRFNNIIT